MGFSEPNFGGNESPIILTESDFAKPDRLFLVGDWNTPQGKLYSRLDDMTPFEATRIVQAHPELFRQYAPLIQKAPSIDYVLKLLDKIPTYAEVLSPLFQEVPKLIECYVSAAYANPRALESTEPPVQIGRISNTLHIESIRDALQKAKNLESKLRKSLDNKSIASIPLFDETVQIALHRAIDMQGIDRGTTLGLYRLDTHFSISRYEILIQNNGLYTDPAEAQNIRQHEVTGYLLKDCTRSLIDEVRLFQVVENNELDPNVIGPKLEEVFEEYWMDYGTVLKDGRK